MKTLRWLLDKGRSVSAFLKPMRIPLHSAYTCFFLILSLFPGLLLLLGLLRYTQIGVDELIGLLAGWVPESLLPTLQALAAASYRHSSSVVVSISAVAALYSASRGMFGILGGLHAVYDTGREKGYWRRKAVSMVYTAAFLLLLTATLVLHIFGNAILDYLWMTTHPTLMTLLQLVDFRGLFLLLLLSSLFGAMYALLPGRRNRLRACLPGATAAALGWLLFSRLFSVYVEHFTTYTNIYGSVYALALGMLWLYFCICIFFYGGALNRWLSQTKPTKGDIER
ncbi:MAG: YihY/virulence factor BrkB family protein [Ruminococcaceae bacterium]|nr:YihY/virulence factor BrkB family protein [Oscillospiraceae bacterium]